MMFGKPKNLPSVEKAFPGRDDEMAFENTAHFVNKHSFIPPWPDGFEQAQFGMGCFWGAERLFWQLDGVWITAVGYSAGITPNATYEEVCTGLTAHNEVVLVVFDPAKITYDELLQHFWQGHNPTQAMRQGNDIGTQYRSGIYTYDDTQQKRAEQSRQRYQAQLDQNDHDKIQTEIIKATKFYYAEEAHQQYLAKNPAGYCGIGGTGVACPMPMKNANN